MKNKKGFIYQICQMKDIFFGFRECIICRRETKSESKFCWSCLRNLPYLPANQQCRSCAEEIQIGTTFCGTCSKEPIFEHANSLFRYQSEIRSLILDLKFKKKLYVAHSLGYLLACHFNSFLRRHKIKPNFIIPVPLSQKRYYQRGFNQAYQLIKETSKLLKIPINQEAAFRVRSTRPQSEIRRRTERISNLRGSFAIQPSFQAESVIIFDDVVTTKATVIDLARALRKNGTKKLFLWCCARD